MNSRTAIAESIMSRHNTDENDIRQEIMETLTEQSREFAEAQHALRQRTREQETALRASLALWCRGSLPSLIHVSPNSTVRLVWRI